MTIKYVRKPFANIPHDTDKFRPVNTREKTFIKTCIKELKEYGRTICFTLNQIEEIKKQIEIVEICYNERNDCYFLFSKR